MYNQISYAKAPGTPSSIITRFNYQQYKQYKYYKYLGFLPELFYLNIKN